MFKKRKAQLCYTTCEENGFMNITILSKGQGREEKSITLDGMIRLSTTLDYLVDTNAKQYVCYMHYTTRCKKTDEDQKLFHNYDSNKPIYMGWAKNVPKIGQNIIVYGVSSNDINDEITTGKKAEEKPACFTVNAVVYQYENVYVCDVDSKIILAVEVVR